MFVVFFGSDGIGWRLFYSIFIVCLSYIYSIFIVCCKLGMIWEGWGVVYMEKKVYLCRLFEKVFTEKKVIDYES